MSLSKQAASLAARCARSKAEADSSAESAPSSFSVRFRPPRSDAGVLGLLGVDPMWGDIRRFFKQRSEQLASQEWTPSAVREVEKSLLEDSAQLRGSFLGCLRHVCDMEQAISRGMTPAEAGFLRKLRRKLESKTPFLKGALAKHAEELLREAEDAADWNSLLGLCDLARVLGARTGRNPLHQPLVSDSVFWEVLFGLALQARSWNRLHKGGTRRVRPLDVYIGASLAPSESGELLSLSQMRASATDGAWMTGTLDRWLHDIVQHPGDSLITRPEWSTPWTWLRQAADQIVASPVGTRGAVVNTIARALQEMGWDADRPKSIGAARLQANLEEMATSNRGMSHAPVAKARSLAAAPDTGIGFETGSFSIFQEEESKSGAEAVAGGGFVAPARNPERAVFRDEFKEKSLAWKETLVSGITPQGRAWWEDFLRLLESAGGDRAVWAAQLRTEVDPALVCGFEDLVRYLYPAPVRPGRLSFRCLDRFPPDPRDERDHAVLDLLYSACDECFGTTPQPTPLVAARRWQAQSDARFLPSHSPDWWRWVAQEGSARAASIQAQATKELPVGDRSGFLALPQCSEGTAESLQALAGDLGKDPIKADEELHALGAAIEIAKEQALRDLLTRF